jgi:hypothetical protein
MSTVHLSGNLIFLQWRVGMLNGLFREILQKTAQRLRTSQAMTLNNDIYFLEEFFR